jgi:hypothetical protein
MTVDSSAVLEDNIGQAIANYGGDISSFGMEYFSAEWRRTEK